MTYPKFMLSVDGREQSFDREENAFAAAANAFETLGQTADISIAMGGSVYVGPLQMRHWWMMKKRGQRYVDIPY